MCCIRSDVLPSKTETTMWQALKWQDHTCLTIFLCSRHTPNKTLQSNNNNACLTLLILKALHECFLLNATCRVFAKSLKDKVGRKGHNSFAAKPHPCRASKENKTDTSSETVSSEDPLAGTVKQKHNQLHAIQLNQKKIATGSKCICMDAFPQTTYCELVPVQLIQKKWFYDCGVWFHKPWWLPKCSSSTLSYASCILL